MVEPSNIRPDTGLINPQEVAGNFGVPTGTTEKPVLSGEPSESNQKNQTTPKENKGYGLTPKQQLKQDAALWSEFLYSEYKREKALREGAQTMPTHYDNSDA
jgi:hypothetical protein